MAATLASLVVSNYFDSQVPSSLPQLQHDNNRLREQLNQLSSTLGYTSFVYDAVGAAYFDHG